jgi:hypothetical protein
MGRARRARAGTAPPRPCRARGRRACLTAEGRLALPRRLLALRGYSAGSGRGGVIAASLGCKQGTIRGSRRGGDEPPARRRASGRDAEASLTSRPPLPGIGSWSVLWRALGRLAATTEADAQAARWSSVTVIRRTASAGRPRVLVISDTPWRGPTQRLASVRIGGTWFGRPSSNRARTDCVQFRAGAHKRRPVSDVGSGGPSWPGLRPLVPRGGDACRDSGLC